MEDKAVGGFLFLFFSNLAVRFSCSPCTYMALLLPKTKSMLVGRVDESKLPVGVCKLPDSHHKTQFISISAKQVLQSKHLEGLQFWTAAHRYPTRLKAET